MINAKYWDGLEMVGHSKNWNRKATLGTCGPKVETKL